MTGTIFLGGTARRKPSGARSQVAGAWRKEINRCNKSRQASFLKNLLVGTWRNQSAQQAEVSLWGPGLGAGALGLGPQGLTPPEPLPR